MVHEAKGDGGQKSVHMIYERPNNFMKNFEKYLAQE